MGSLQSLVQLEGSSATPAVVWLCNYRTTIEAGSHAPEQSHRPWTVLGLRHFAANNVRAGLPFSSWVVADTLARCGLKMLPEAVTCAHPINTALTDLPDSTCPYPAKETP